jgi:hypothetical protein
VGISLKLSELLRGTVYRDNATPSHTQRLNETFFESGTSTIARCPEASE